MVFVVIPVHNRKHYLRDCLLSLRKQTFSDFRTIVVDDGSTDGTGEMVRGEFPEVILLTGDGNLWWTGAVNEGVRYAMGRRKDDDFVLTLNDDLVVSEGYVATLMAAARSHPRALIGSVEVDIRFPEIIHPGGSGVTYASRWISKGVLINPGRRLDAFEPGHFEETAMLTGKGSLIPVSAFREIGLFNRKHYTFIGDTEFFVRANRAGYRLLVAYDAVVYSHTRNEGHIAHQGDYTLRDLGRYFFGIKSYTNLRARFWLAMDTRDNLLQGLSFFLTDLVRMCYHFVRKMRSF